MARITVEDCLKQIPNRFMLVNMVARRVRQIREGSEYLVNSPKNEDVVVSLREIAAGKLTLGSASDEENAGAIEGMTALEEVESMISENQDEDPDTESDGKKADAKEEKEE